MSDDESIIECKGCGVSHTVAPEEDWRGWCPPCLIREKVYPLIPDQRLIGLLEVFLHRVTDDDSVQGIVVVIPRTSTAETADSLRRILDLDEMADVTDSIEELRQTLYEAIDKLRKRQIQRQRLNQAETRNPRLN